MIVNSVKTIAYAGAAVQPPTIKQAIVAVWTQIVLKLNEIIKYN